MELKEKNQEENNIPVKGEKTQSEKKKLHTKVKKFWLVWFLSVFLLLILPVSLYFSSPARAFFSGFLKRVPYPIVWIKGAGFITSQELLSDLEAVKIFYRSEDFAAQGLRIDFTTQDGKDRLKIKEKDILDKLVEDKIIEALALEQEIEVTKEEAGKDIVEKVNQAGNNKTFALNLKQNYDWSINDFRDKVVIPQLYLRKLLAWYDENDETAKATKEKIFNIQKELGDKGENFSQLAKQYSEGDSAESGGGLGWFKKEELVIEVAEKVFSMKAGEISDVIESPLGWHIVSLEETREVGEGDQKTKEVKLGQIFLRKGSFLEWLMKEKNNFGVWIFVRDYAWDANYSKVDFQDSGMRNKELDLRVKAEGDPSL